MNIAVLANSAYSDAKTSVMTERSTEYQAFARITHRLTKANSGGLEQFNDLVRAISDNRKLWNILAVDVASADNQLPPDLRARIFYLAEFTELHSQKVLAREQDATALIDINTAIMRGLRMEGGEA